MEFDEDLILEEYYESSEEEGSIDARTPLKPIIPKRKASPCNDSPLF